MIHFRVEGALLQPLVWTTSALSLPRGARAASRRRREGAGAEELQVAVAPAGHDARRRGVHRVRDHLQVLQELRRVRPGVRGKGVTVQSWCLPTLTALRHFREPVQHLRVWG